MKTFKEQISATADRLFIDSHKQPPLPEFLTRTWWEEHNVVSVADEKTKVKNVTAEFTYGDKGNLVNKKRVVLTASTDENISIAMCLSVESDQTVSGEISKFRGSFSYDQDGRLTHMDLDQPNTTYYERDAIRISVRSQELSFAVPTDSGLLLQRVGVRDFPLNHLRFEELTVYSDSPKQSTSGQQDT